ncbi:MAG: MFS transporter [Aquisalimonadaceae bacterium]
MISTAMASLVPFPRPELKTVGVVSTAHAFSHLYMLVLPPVFPLLYADLGVNYAALGALLMIYAIATGVMQVPMGLLVDRIGGRAVLALGLGLNAIAIFLVGLIPSYWAIALFMVIAGAGNSVFHPADYAILSARVQDGRVGRAFSMHLFAGYIGWMLAPPAVLALTALTNWRVALMILGLTGVGYAVFLVTQRECLSDEDKRSRARANDAQARSEGRKTGLALLLTPAIAVFFLFYMIVAMAGNGIQTFSVVAIMELHGATLATANFALTAYFIAAAGGTLLGGWLADRIRRHELATAIAFVLSAFVIALIGIHGLPISAVIAMMFAGGFFVAVVSPLRDVMVRNAVPAGSIGTAFGIVTTGFSVGLAASPVLLGWVNDLGRPEFVFWITALITLVGILTLVAVRTVRVPRTPPRSDLADAR